VKPVDRSRGTVAPTEVERCTCPSRQEFATLADTAGDGGKPELAQAGGSEPSGLAAAPEKVQELVAAVLG